MKPIPSFALYRLVAYLALAGILLPAPVQSLTLDLQRRNQGTGAITLQKEEVDPKRIGVIAEDVWNFHWCKIATMRVDAFVPKINNALEAARALGMKVMLNAERPESKFLSVSGGLSSTRSYCLGVCLCVPRSLRLGPLANPA